MSFVLRMALREIRASWQRLLFFFVCIAIGVASIVAIRSVIQSVRVTLAGEARALLAVRRHRAVEPAMDRPRADERSRRNSRPAASVARSEAVELATMVRPASPARSTSRMVELRAVQAAFPFYGQLTLEGRPYRHALLQGRGVLVRPELLAQLGLAVGDRSADRHAERSRSAASSRPSRAAGWARSRSVRASSSTTPTCESTGLLAFGSRASFQMLLRVPEPALEPLSPDLRAGVRQRVRRRAALPAQRRPDRARTSRAPRTT